jgi:hypothetical protein
MTNALVVPKFPSRDLEAMRFRKQNGLDVKCPDECPYWAHALHDRSPRVARFECKRRFILTLPGSTVSLSSTQLKQLIKNHPQKTAA